MVCPKCGKELPNDANFCLNCGEDVNESTQSAHRMQLRCKVCGGVMNADDENRVLSCPYCGSKELMIDSDEVKIEEIRNRTYKEVELGKQQTYKEVELCKEMGFTVESQKRSITFEAYNEEGYFVDVYYSEYDDKMNITVEPPIELYEFQWSTGELASMLPIPESNIGKISRESESSFSAYVGETTKAQYSLYVNACIEKGFNVDYGKGEEYFYGDNKDGYQLSVYYEGNNIMQISLYAPRDTE